MSEKICKNLSIYRKTSKSYQLTFTRDGGVIDITGWTIYFTAKEKMEDEDNEAKIKKDITSHVDAENGKTLIELTSTDTDLPSKTYFYDIKFVDDQDNSDILFSGRLLIKKPVTTRG